MAGEDETGADENAEGDPPCAEAAGDDGEEGGDTEDAPIRNKIDAALKKRAELKLEKKKADRAVRRLKKKRQRLLKGTRALSTQDLQRALDLRRAEAEAKAAGRAAA